MDQQFVTKHDFLEAHWDNLLYKFDESYSEERTFALVFLFKVLLSDLYEEFNKPESAISYIEKIIYDFHNSRVLQEEKEHDI